MEEALRFFRTYEVWIYLLLALAGFLYLRKFIIAWEELRGAAFGLERDSAQARLNQAASILVLLLTMVVIVFILVSFIAPAMPGAAPLPTPTLDLLATPTITLPPPALETPGAAVPVTDTLSIASTPFVGDGCTPGQVSIAVPGEGQEIRGSVDISGTVDITNFGFYKFEMKLQDSQDWLTILAGNEPKRESILGTWNTSLLSPGNYQLGLVVTDNQGQSLPPCIVNVRIATPVETPLP